MEAMARVFAESVKAILDEKSVDTSMDRKFDNFDRIDQNDILDPPVSLYSPFANYIIIDDMKDGQRVVLPYGMEKLVFKFEYSKKLPRGDKREEQLMNISKYICRSKKILEWLKSSSFWNVFIFEGNSGAVNADTALVVDIVRLSQAVRKMGQAEVIRQLQGANLPVDMNNPEANTLTLLTHMAQMRHKESLKAVMDRATENMKFAMLSQDKNAKSVSDINIDKDKAEFKELR